ncbi:protein FAR1-RELATED SEQUENCE 7 [Malania oleifera]|uniref:protein FAR1-RELATED SEQUENCE 7 n=1 Tax=Malania oleifera TaxID=397392 RepID=UPI0025ADFD19|nr:protein FAR1-RELATED SEQUENCE 7 [Malania oleifera]XP_057956745.1 protein FAR1-RELATED SEQUENCE 7 [Malania oleifera]
MIRRLCGNNTMNLKAKPLRAIGLRNGGNIDDEGESKLEPHVGLEFDSADDAREFYNLYAMQVGFKIRTGQLYRSRVDGSVTSRRFVCSKEGFQLNSRTGCPAFVRVQKQESGKWLLDHIQKDHNHELELSGQTNQPPIPLKALTVSKKAVVYRRPSVQDEDEEDDGRPCPSGVINVKRLKREEWERLPKVEPYLGLEFNSANEAYKFYYAYASNTGFKVRIGQLFRSRDDGSISSRRFVCSKEGHQHPSRVGCRAYLRVRRRDSGRWVVDRLVKEHNHDLDSPGEASKKLSASSKGFREEVSSVLENLGLVETDDANLIKIGRDNNIGSDWYHVFLEYFQSRQAEDTGFFYAVEVDDGKCRSVFWADSRSRFACSQFGDAIVFDTTYRKNNYLVPFASFVGINHHKQPVLLGCALIADESKESFTWIFQAWLRAMSGCRPLSIIADQDKVIQEAIAQVFPGTRHRFSAWQIKVKEWENLSLLLSMDSDFKYEYDKCIFQSQTDAEFDSAWNAILNKYGLMENAWLREMHAKCESWVPLYLRATFFAGIPLNGTLKSYFGTLLNCQTPLREFVLQYERSLQQSREEENQDDFDSFNLQPILHTKEPVEEQCRRLYTNAVFKVFQKELLDCYGYFGLKIYEEGIISRYLLRKCGNENEKHIVTFNGSNLSVNCSCQMFEFEGLLCRHVLKVFQMLNIREIPSCYILHRWTKNAKYGILHDVESGGSSQDLKALMVWSLREEARNYIESGVTSFERYKLAFEIMREGRRNIWQK